MSPIERSGGGGSSAGGLVKLFESTLAAPATSIDTGAGGIAGGHGDLMVFISGRSDRAGNSTENISVNFNADAGANYDSVFTRNIAGAISDAHAFAATVATVGQLPGATATANVSGEITLHIPSYDKTVFFKSLDGLGGMLNTSVDYVAIFASCLWHNTGAITRMAVSTGTGSNFLTGTRVAIYGAQ